MRFHGSTLCQTKQLSVISFVSPLTDYQLRRLAGFFGPVLDTFRCVGRSHIRTLL